MKKDLLNALKIIGSFAILALLVIIAQDVSTIRVHIERNTDYYSSRVVEEAVSVKASYPLDWMYVEDEDTIYIYDYSLVQPTDDIREYALLCMETLGITHYEPEIYTVDLREYGDGFILYAVEI